MPNVKYSKVLDTRLEAVSSNDICFVVEQGASIVNYTPLNSSSHSNNNTTWNLNNIADVTCRQSRLVMGMTVTLSMNVENTTASNINVIGSDNFGFKQFPLNRCITSVQHQINQASYTLNSYDILDSISRLNYRSNDMNFYENTQPDIINSYANATGTNINPLASYSTTIQGDGVFKPRTLNYTIVGNTVPANSNAVVVVTATLYEPLITPFTDISSKDTRGLYAITGELITQTYVNDLFNNMFCFIAPTGITMTNPVVSLGNSAYLYTVYLTPKEETIAQIPRESVYQYTDYSIFSNIIGNGIVTAGTTFQASSQVVNFTNLPSKILVYARLSNNFRTCATPDKYLAIQSLNCTFDNGSPMLNNTDLRGNQLWEVSTRNGLVMPRIAFQQGKINNGVAGFTGDLFGCGAMMVIDPCLDLGIRPTDCAGSAGRYVFQVSATFSNLTDEDFAGVTMYVVGLTNGILERVGGQYRNYLLSTPFNIVNEVKDLSPISHLEYTNSKHSNSFLSGGGIGDFFKKAYNMASKIPKYITTGRDIINTGRDIYGKAQKGVSQVRKMIGMGGAQYGHSIHPSRNMELFYE